MSTKRTAAQELAEHDDPMAEFLRRQEVGVVDYWAERRELDPFDQTAPGVDTEVSS